MLIPASYVVRVAYGEEYRIVEKKGGGDLAIFPAIHPTPDSAMPRESVIEALSSLQVRQGSDVPFLYDNYVREVSSRFEQAMAQMKTEHNFEYGTEFEVAICKTLRTVLPQKYGICRGYVVSAYGEKAGDDIVIFDRMRFPTLRALDTDDFSCKEQVPIEAVYAYIEAKHSICISGQGGTSLQKALTQVAQVKMLCDRRSKVSHRDGDQIHPTWPEVRNPAFGIIVSRHVRLKEGDAVVEDPEVIRQNLQDTKFQTLFAPDFCVFGSNNILIPVQPRDEPEKTWMPSPFFRLGKSGMDIGIVDGVSFGAGLSILLWALDWIQLGEMPWPEILRDCILRKGTSM